MNYRFTATLEIIGVNPFVFVPEEILQALFRIAGKTKGPVPVAGQVNGKPYTQTLVRFQGHWRLYINTLMLKDSPKRIGEVLDIQIALDTQPRIFEMPEKFRKALEVNRAAKARFDGLSESRKTEIVRYLARLKSDEALERNILRAIDFLLGKAPFVGRQNP